MAIDAGTISAQVRVALDKLKGDVAAVEAQMSKIGNKAEQTAGSTEKSFSDSFGAMSIAGVAAFAAITMAMKEAISVSGEYEQSIANVQSVVMGARDVFLQLDEAAKFAGQSTRFTASQAADALYDLASGGLDATESVGALDGVLMLAGASQSNLSSTAAVVVATLNQYNLKAEESSRISNVFSAAIANSMATMEKLTASMRMAGPVSSALGISLEETVGSLEALYDAGFQGEQAGTALRAIMSALAAETDPTTQKLMALGLTFEQLNPAANSFADVIGNIASVGATAGDIMSAFGTRAGAQMLTLLSAGKKGINDYTAAITDTNTAAEMYAIQNDTLRGSLDKLKSAAESAMIEFSEEFTPVMRGALEIVTKMLVAVSELPGPLKVFFAILLTGTPIVLGLAKAFTLLSLAVNSMTGGIGLIVTALVAGVAGIAGFASAINDANMKSTEKEFGDLAKEVGLTADEMKRLSEAAENLGLDPKNLKDMADEAGLTSDAILMMKQAFDRGLGGITITEIIPAWADAFDTTQEAIMRLLLTFDKLKAADKDLITRRLSAIDVERERIAVAKAAGEAIEGQISDINSEKEAIRKAEEAKQQAIRETASQRDQLYVEYQKILDDIDRRVTLGAVSEVDANKEKAKATEKLIDSLLDLNVKYIDVDGNVKELVATSADYVKAADDQTAADKASADAIADKATANEQAATTMKTYAERAEDVGKTEKELLELSRKREIAIIDESKADDQAKKAAVLAINTYYDAYIKLSDKQAQDAVDKKLEQTAESYRKKLEEVGKTTAELMELEQARAIAAIEAGEGTDADKQEAIDAINAYYEKVADNSAILAKQKAEKEAAKEKEKLDAENLKALEKQEAEDKKLADEEQRRTDKQIDSSQEYNEKLEDIGKTTSELNEINRARAIAEAESAGGTDDAIQQNIDSINAYYDGLSNHESILSKQKAEEDAAKAKAKIDADALKAQEQQEEELQRQTESQEKSSQSYIEKLEDIGKTESEIMEISRKRAIAQALSSGGTTTAIQGTVDAINAYYDALNNQTAIDKKIADDKKIQESTEAQEQAIEDYEQKLVALTQTTKEAMEAERQRAIASVRLMGGTQDEIDATIDALNEYYDALRDSSSEKAMIAKTKDMVSQIGGAISSLAGSLESLFGAIYDQRMAELEAEEQAALKAAGVQEDTAQEAAQKELELAQETSDDAIEAIQKRLDAATRAGDLESAAVLQVAIDKQKAADAEIISEKKAAVERAKIEADYAEKKKKLEFDAAMASWKIQLASATASAAQAILNGFLTKPFVPAGLVAGGIATGLSAVQVAAVSAAKPRLATGGIVLPQSGGRDVTLAENGYAELALNSGPSGEALMGMFASKIVESMQAQGQGQGSKMLTINLKVDRKTLSSLVVDDINNGRVRLQK